VLRDTCPDYLDSPLFRDLSGGFVEDVEEDFRGRSGGCPGDRR
jgi:hypothetical protein